MAKRNVLDEIYGLFYDRNWGLYTAGDSESIDLIVPRGSVNSLDIGFQHLVLPGNDRKSVQQMKRSIELMNKNQNYPIINTGLGGVVALALLKFEQDFVKVRDANDHWIKYPKFIEYLYGLPQCRF
ncbi:MAG: hypothetical protein AABX95_03180 [Nanoarchaeota archaeon]